MTALRYVIYSRNNTLLDTNKSIRYNCDAVEPLVQKIIEHQSGDRDKAEVLYISAVEQGLWVVFDYDNPYHDECTVIGFKIKQRTFTKIKPIFVPPAIIHQRIRGCYGFPTLVGGEVRRPPSVKTVQAASEKQATPSDLITPSSGEEKGEDPCGATGGMKQEGESSGLE
ncbi:hypothetical protein TOPH_07322 [Tolypocladium ophioglossoides CBS 100239]|uniref:Uncharacterized protein n=1 Tax=Tolypocladium ophioglossoides (strain CBS 100239) TaxID=1163406 RepID=A0A0L0N239_TOLOC|nr:hypothetical protein TOPH_07322 [Tolypocladium ophioglossoides CBS 100239]